MQVASCEPVCHSCHLTSYESSILSASYERRARERGRGRPIAVCMTSSYSSYGCRVRGSANRSLLRQVCQTHLSLAYEHQLCNLRVHVGVVRASYLRHLWGFFPVTRRQHPTCMIMSSTTDRVSNRLESATRRRSAHFRDVPSGASFGEDTEDIGLR